GVCSAHARRCGRADPQDAAPGSPGARAAGRPYETGWRRGSADRRAASRGGIAAGAGGRGSGGEGGRREAGPRPQRRSAAAGGGGSPPAGQSRGQRGANTRGEGARPSQLRARPHGRGGAPRVGGAPGRSAGRNTCPARRRPAVQEDLMALRKAARVVVALALLFLLYAVVRQLPLLRWIVQGARFMHALGWPGALATLGAIYLLTLLLFPIIPLIVACGWLYGPSGSIISLTAAVASAATSFSLARALGGAAAAQALLERPKARALANLAAEGGFLTVTLIRLSPLLPYTPSNAVMGLTPMRLRDLVLGTAIGMAPGTFLYSWA